MLVFHLPQNNNLFLLYYLFIRKRKNKEKMIFETGFFFGCFCSFETFLLFKIN